MSVRPAPSSQQPADEPICWESVNTLDRGCKPSVLHRTMFHGLVASVEPCGGGTWACCVYDAASRAVTGHLTLAATLNDAKALCETLLRGLHARVELMTLRMEVEEVRRHVKAFAAWVMAGGGEGKGP